MPLGKFVVAALVGLAAGNGFARETAPAAPDRPESLFRPHGNFSNNVARPLRYWPVDGALVITNGAETFNRPLYSANSGFRIDGGDRPEFSLYLPGRGGNLRLGCMTALGTNWLQHAHQIITRYQAGSLHYEIHDPALDPAWLELTVLPLGETKGTVLRAEWVAAETPAIRPGPAELFFAYGGASGTSGSRGGDIGCERQPVSEFFQFQPGQCLDNHFTLAGNGFTLRHGKITITGVTPPGSQWVLADAANWNAPVALLAATDVSPGPETLSVIVGRTAMEPNHPLYFALQSLGGNAESPALDGAQLPQLFAAAEAHRRALAERVTVQTPDPFINAAVPALCVAADAVWDSSLQCFMHGAVAWRVRLLGWRGPYAGDALGWHERTAAHFAGFARQQNTSPIPAELPPADEQFNLARSEAAIHSNGDLSKNHYDMNLVGVDAMFRHLLWTGDTNYARAMWPVIERHLAWERRLFRREFGPEKLPLYEAYAAIWASDDLNYNGGGTAHASAYNYFANNLAARVARMLGADPAPYEKESALILRGMNEYLWLPEAGNFAESKDLLGLQLVHPNSGLWTFYHTLDSAVATPAQAWQMSRWVDAHIARIPITGPQVPDEGLFTLPETSWMPYQWSLNNVVMAESAHAALGYWQANRPDTAFALFKGELLDSMFLGLCPGNFGCMTAHDMARGEAQRDFADAIGCNARALVEGLFGVQPDALAGTLKIVPGFPGNWPYASLRHPDLEFAFERVEAAVAGAGLERYTIRPHFPRPMALDLQIAARGTPAEVTVNGKSAAGNPVKEGCGTPRFEIQCPAAAAWEISVKWQGARPLAVVPPEPKPVEPVTPKPFDWNAPIPAAALETVDLTPFFNDQVTRIFRNEYRSPRSPFASLATPLHGLGGWCEPDASFDVDDSGLRRVAGANGGRITLRDGIFFATPTGAGATNVIYTSQWDNYPRAVTVPLRGKSAHAFLLMAGSTGPLQSQFDNGEVVVTYADGTTTTLTLRNPVNWWPIDQDYFTDDFAFRRAGPLPPRVDLATGTVRYLNAAEFKGHGGRIRGGAATVLDLPLDPGKPLQSLTVRTLANEVVIGLLGVTLQRGAGERRGMD